jgi:hypothetical protein
MQGILGKLSLSDIQGPRGDFEQKLAGTDKENPWENHILRIDRATPFNPITFLGEGWSIWKGPVDGNGLTGEEEQDKRSLVLTTIDLTSIRLEPMFKKGEVYIKGEEKLKRLKSAGHIRLDAKVFQTIWENQHLIPEKWKEKTNGYTTYIFFDGTTIRPPHGHRYVLYLSWPAGQWFWGYHWLDLDWVASGPSAVLAN